MSYKGRSLLLFQTVQSPLSIAKLKKRKVSYFVYILRKNIFRWFSKELLVKSYFVNEVKMSYGFDLLFKKKWTEKVDKKKILKSDFNLLLCLQLMFPHLDSMWCIPYQSFVQLPRPWLMVLSCTLSLPGQFRSSDRLLLVSTPSWFILNWVYFQISKLFMSLLTD